MPHHPFEEFAREPAETGRYERQVCLGRGACGVVYLARDRVIARTVALKIVEFDASMAQEVRAEMASRSEREARAAGALNHPNIVTVYDAGPGPSETSFFIVMEYVEGQTLSSRLEQGPLSPRETVRIGMEIADALEYAHRMGVVHRDVKPANILIRRDGVAKIADFGVARFESSDLTLTGQWVGSPAYMSPEQAQGRPADARSDIFALGVVLYEMLTGDRPFSAETLAGLSYQIVHEDPVPPCIISPDLDPGWDEIIAKAMAKKPEERFASAGDLATELDSLMPGVGGTLLSGAPRPSNPGIATATLELEVEPLGRSGSGDADNRISWSRIAAAVAVILVPVLLIVGLHQLERLDSASPAGEMSIRFDGKAAGSAGDWRGKQAAGATAKLVVNVLHGLDSGRVEIGVDGRPLWVQSIHASEEGPNLSTLAKRIRGIAPTTTGELEVPAGEPEIRVSVISEEGSWTQTTSRRLEAGDKETLNVRIRTGRTTGMELKWAR